MRAVRHLVASAVEGLKPERVSIVDERGRLLADGANGRTGRRGSARREAGRASSAGCEAQIEEIVARDRRAAVAPACRWRPNSTSTASRAARETFDPESRVVRSTQTRTENRRPRQREGHGQCRQRAARRQRARAASPATARDASNKNEEVANYEISRTTRTGVIEGGRLKRLSVAVLVDGVYSRGANGEATYQPRPPGGARPHRGSGAHRHRLRPQPRRPGRGGQPALRRGAGAVERPKSPGFLRLPVQPDQEDDLCGCRARRARAADADRAALRRAAAGQRMRRSARAAGAGGRRIAWL